MSRRIWVLAFAAAAAIVLLSPHGSALPSCKSMWSYSTCNSQCQFNGQGYCTYVWAFESDCSYMYTCETGFPISGNCVCPDPPKGGGGCFLAGTGITMADGTTKPIEDIVVGDVVLAYDKATGEMRPDPVKRLHAPYTADSYLIVNGHLRITTTQPVFSDGRWVEISRLKVGDSLTGADGKPVPIEKIEVVEGPITVYNFDTNPYETFVAGGFIVHRKQETTEP